jgi:post-segregation antitoxin (ccd killing protein)
VKKHTTVYLEAELIREAKEHGLNISFICSAALNMEIHKKLGIDPRLREIEAHRSSAKH